MLRCVKLPGGVYILSPVRCYDPDCAISYYKGTIKHIYFVTETNVPIRFMQIKDIEKVKIRFDKISGENVIYEVLDSYKYLMDIGLG